MNDPKIDEPTKADKKRKPSRSLAVRGKWSVDKFRGLLERIAAHPQVFADDQIRFVQEMLQSLAGDNQGIIRVTISALAETPASPKRRFSSGHSQSSETADDDAIRTTAREIALLKDEATAFERIDGLGDDFLHKAAALYSFKATSRQGLKSAFAAVVSDVRQMENIAAARPRSAQTQPGS